MTDAVLKALQPNFKYICADKNVSQQTIKTIYVGLSVDKEVTASFSPHRLFYTFDWKQAVLARGEEGREGDRRGLGSKSPLFHYFDNRKIL